MCDVILGCEHLDLVTKGDNGVGGGAGPEGGDDLAGVDDKIELGESNSALSQIFSLDTILVGVITLVGILDLEIVGTGDGSDLGVS